MSNLIPFVISFFLPGSGQLILGKFKKGGIILLTYLGVTLLLFYIDFLSAVPLWIPHVVLMIYAVFDVYDHFEENHGKKSATRYFAFSTLIAVLFIPLFLTLFTTGMFKGAEFFTDEFLNEDRTKNEMNKISVQLERHKSLYGEYPDNYKTFIGKKPIWGGWNTDAWQNPYKYELADSLTYSLRSAGKDGEYYNEDDLVISND